MKFAAKNFSELSASEIYEIIKSRTEIFLLEQNIVCQDLDDVDNLSLHCFFKDGKRVVAYLRAYKGDCPGTVSMGRVLTLEHRKGTGRELMQRSVAEIKKYFNCNKISVHAQKSAIGFYEKLGFCKASDEFLEEGVVHVTMEKEV